MMNGNGPQAQPQQRAYDGNIPVPITLPLATWSVILNLVAEAPWKTADPLLKALNGQIELTLQKSPTMPAPMPGEPALNRPE